MSAEDDRAAEFRRSLAAREASVRRRERSLRGSPSAFFALREKWRPWWFPQPVAPDPPDSDLTN
jgi:hypothetical protein